MNANAMMEIGQREKRGAVRADWDVMGGYNSSDSEQGSGQKGGRKVSKKQVDDDEEYCAHLEPTAKQKKAGREKRRREEIATRLTELVHELGDNALKAADRATVIHAATSKIRELKTQLRSLQREGKSESQEAPLLIDGDKTNEIHHPKEEVNEEVDTKSEQEKSHEIASAEEKREPPGSPEFLDEWHTTWMSSFSKVKDSEIPESGMPMFPPVDLSIFDPSFFDADIDAKQHPPVA